MKTSRYFPNAVRVSRTHAARIMITTVSDRLTLLDDIFVLGLGVQEKSQDVCLLILGSFCICKREK